MRAGELWLCKVRAANIAHRVKERDRAWSLSHSTLRDILPACDWDNARLPSRNYSIITPSLARCILFIARNCMYKIHKLTVLVVARGSTACCIVLESAIYLPKLHSNCRRILKVFFKIFHTLNNPTIKDLHLACF